MSVIITADSTCDLPKSIATEREITIIPLSVLFDNKSFKDGIEISRDDIYSHVKKAGDLPKTAAVTPAQYYDAFKAATDAGHSVVHIGLSSAISSSFQNAVLAAADFKNVYCVDSKNLCAGMGLLVLKACDLRDRGFEAKKIAARINALVPKVHSSFVLDSLEYLHKGGRCSSVAKFGANVLGLKPVIGVDPATGKMDVIKKYRGKSEAVCRQYINDTLHDISKADPSRLIIAQSGGIPGEISAFALGMAQGHCKFNEIINVEAGCTISSHCGPKTFALFYMKK